MWRNSTIFPFIIAAIFWIPAVLYLIFTPEVALFTNLMRSINSIVLTGHP